MADLTPERAESLIEKTNKVLEILRDKGYSRKEVSDGYHTFDELYYHRMVLFSIICNDNKDRAWKARFRYDGTMFGEDSFIVGINTPEGQYTYHYNLEFWDMYDVEELDYAPIYDGHQPEDITRLLSL